jgi:hypothetical protein
MNETIDTRGQFDTSLPDGEREFRVEKITRREKGMTVMYIWQVSFDGTEGERETGDQLLLPSMMSDLLRVLGCKEILPKQFEWDRDLIVGKYFIARVSREPDKKDPSKIRQQMTSFQKSSKVDDDIPF